MKKLEPPTSDGDVVIAFLTGECGVICCVYMWCAMYENKKQVLHTSVETLII